MKPGMVRRWRHLTSLLRQLLSGVISLRVLIIKSGTRWLTLPATKVRQDSISTMDMVLSRPKLHMTSSPNTIVRQQTGVELRHLMEEEQRSMSNLKSL